MAKNEEFNEVSEGKAPVGKTLSDAARLELFKPVVARVRNRLKEIQELSRAKSVKIKRGHMNIWHTTPPKMFICNLESQIVGNRGIITYQVYDTQKNPKTGNIEKKVYRQTREDEKTGREIVVNMSYTLGKMVVETIEAHKPMTVEEIDPNKAGDLVFPGGN